MATTTINIDAAVSKAEARADDLGVDLRGLRAHVRATLPGALNDAHDQNERRHFLETMYDHNHEADLAFERIIAGNELQPANFLPRGAMAARPVMRVVLHQAGGRLIGYGTGFLIGDGVLLTNNHVLGNSDDAALATAEAFYEVGINGTDMAAQCYELDPGKLFYTSEDLDFTIVAVSATDRNGGASLVSIGWLPLVAMTGKVMEGEWLTIVQHPNGEMKQLCVRENQLIKRADDVLWYSTDTMGGSSGSPVFNNDWQVVALHHMGVPDTKDGKWQTVDGRDYDATRDREDQIKWIANEGIRVSRIVETLRTDNKIAGNPIVQALLDTGADDLAVRLPIMFRPGAAPPDLLAAAQKLSTSGPQPATEQEVEPLAPGQGGAGRLVMVTLAIDDDGGVSLADSSAAPVEAAFLEAARPRKTTIDAPVEPETDWVNGFDPAFLGAKAEWLVNLPDVLPDLSPRERAAVVTPLNKAPFYGEKAPTDAECAAGVLDYNGYSLVMHRKRRIAFYSAANVDGGVEFPGLSRPPDRWLYDERIPRTAQIGNSFYARNQIDRGHLTRREDMEWGVNPVDATRRANGTCTWCNCSPQHELFNQNRSPDKAIQLWGGLEKYILEQTARHDKFRLHAITGPIFDENDPVYRGVQIPIDFWKVVVAVDAEDRLFATAYILSQSSVLDVDTLDEAAIETPFAQFQTYQCTIEEVEQQTGLVFTSGKDRVSLRDADPLARELAKPAWKRRRREVPPTATEAMSIEAPILSGDEPLSGWDDIVLP